jgi:SAM-dependent methyltransferase
MSESPSIPDDHFDAAYSHMLFNMRFSLEDLRFIFSEINRVLKPNGFNFFSVRNQNDKSYGSGIEIDYESNIRKNENDVNCGTDLVPAIPSESDL